MTQIKSESGWVLLITIAMMLLSFVGLMYLSNYYNTDDNIKNTTNLCVGWYFEEQNRTVGFIELLNECTKPECKFSIDDSKQTLNIIGYNLSCDYFEMNCDHIILYEHYQCNTIIKTTNIEPYGDIFYPNINGD